MQIPPAFSVVLRDDRLKADLDRISVSVVMKECEEEPWILREILPEPTDGISSGAL